MTQAIATHDEHAVQTGVVLIPLNKLKKSPANARKTPHAKADIEALAASIHAKGILQNLVVAPELAESGAATGFYFVTIGEGRRQAQLLRVKRKQIAETEPVRCVIDTGNDAAEISLDENVTRSAMSVMDEVEAFAGLVDGGMSVDDVARRFGCTVRLVEQRLALARLSPKIRAAYRKGDINLDVARAFSINDDHAAQERVFRQLAKPITHAASVRSALTAGRIPAHDRLARFVGAGAYEAAGGRMVRDLFEPDIVFFDDGELLQRLAVERLDTMREALAAEGWGWVETLTGHGQVDGCAGERLHPTQRKLKPAEKKEIAALEARLESLDEKLEDADEDNPLWIERDEIDAKLDGLREAARVFDPKLMKHAGAAVAIDRDGRPIITKGLIKRADAKAIAKLRKPAVSPADGPGVAEVAEAEEGAGPRLTKALTERRRKPWDGARTGAVLPRRATGETYRGVNVILLWSAAIERGYVSPYWLTFNQAVKLGAQVRKGERGEVVVYYGQGTRTRISEGGAEVEDAFRFLKWYVVFSADQIDNLPARFHPASVVSSRAPLAAHEDWFERLEIARIATRDIACYVPSKDVIGMPPVAAFDTAEDYAATLNHESVHATMAPHRVGRDMGKKFSQHAIAAEELVAEIGASILGAHLRLPPQHIHDHASYIGHWMKLLADDKRAFLTAAAQAQVAVDWLLAKSPSPFTEEEIAHVAA